MVDTRQIHMEHQAWLAEEAQANEKLPQALVSLASGSVADWGGLVLHERQARPLLSDVPAISGR